MADRVRDDGFRLEAARLGTGCRGFEFPGGDTPAVKLVELNISPASGLRGSVGVKVPLGISGVVLAVLEGRGIIILGDWELTSG